jgi:hypothetical protein
MILAALEASFHVRSLRPSRRVQVASRMTQLTNADHGVVLADRVDHQRVALIMAHDVLPTFSYARVPEAAMPKLTTQGPTGRAE